MKHFIITACLLAAPAFATERGPNATANSTSAASSSAIDYYDGGRSWALMNAGRAAPMPATNCPMHDTDYLSVLWGLYTRDVSRARVDHACLDKVLASIKPVPAPVVLPTVDKVSPTVDKCLPPAKARSVVQAKAAGSCK